MIRGMCCLTGFIYLTLMLPSGVTADSTASAPKYKAGETWEYVAEVDRSGSRVSSSRRFSSGVYHVTIKEDGTVEIDPLFAEGRPTVYDPKGEKKWFEFPLQVGNKWSATYWRSSMRRNENATVTVETEEKVSTPAGSFDTYKLIWDEGWRVITYWYSPKTKSVVKIDSKQFDRSAGTVVNPIKVELTKHSTN